MTGKPARSYKDHVLRGLDALLVEEGVVSADTMELALSRQRDLGGALDTALLELRAVEESRLVEYLSRASDLRVAPERAFNDTDARARRLFPPRVAERHGLAPFLVDGRELSLVATYPVDLGLLEEISFMLSLHLTAYVGPEYRVRQLIHETYGVPLSPRLAALASGTVDVSPLEKVAAPPRTAPPPPPDGEVERSPAAPVDSTANAAYVKEPDGAGQGGAKAEQGQVDLDLDIPIDEEFSLAPPVDPVAKKEEPAVPAAEAPSPSPKQLDRSAPPRWSLAEARARLLAAHHRDEVVLVALRYARDFFEFAALFTVVRDAVAGYDAIGVEDGARELARSVALYASDPGVFCTVLETRGQYLGPVTPGAGTEAVLNGLGRGLPRTVLVFPFLVRARLAALLYADNGEAPVSGNRVEDLILLLSMVGKAFERVLADQKRRTKDGPPQKEPWRTREPARPVSPSEPVKEANFPAAEKAQKPSSKGALATDAWRIFPEPPSPNRASLFSVEVSTRSPEPSEAKPSPSTAVMAEVAKRREAEAAPSEERTPADEAPPVRTEKRTRRETLPSATPRSLAESALDEDVVRSAGAREALIRKRGQPGFEEAMDRLRSALSSGSPPASAAAALALGALREVEAVPLLLKLIEEAEPKSAEAAAWALRTITLQPLGKDAKLWASWWEVNRAHSRTEWLLDSLVSPDRDTRALAASELAPSGEAPVAYSVDMVPEDRERAARAWAGFLGISGAPT